MVINPDIKSITNYINIRKKAEQAIMQSLNVPASALGAQDKVIDQLIKKKEECMKHFQELEQVLLRFEKAINKLLPDKKPLHDRSLTEKMHITNLLIEMYKDIE